MMLTDVGLRAPRRELRALAGVIEDSLPHHGYRIEPQAGAYTIRGDLWDHLYGAHLAARRPGVFLPLTLEMGSWLWVKKNPRQLLVREGSFNPIKPHRVQRTLRRHQSLIELLHRAVASHEAWTVLDAPRRLDLARRAFAAWYAR